MSGFRIDDLAGAPEFFDTVADRIWRQWHAPRGASLAELRTRLEDNISGQPLPKAFVARDGATFLGTISLISSDLDERPDLGPWAAALWVEPAARSRGVAAALLDRAIGAGLAIGAPHVYLCAQTRLAAFYLDRGWRLMETDVGPRALSVFRKTCAQE